MSDTLNSLQRGNNKKELAQKVLDLRAQVRTEDGQDPNIREANDRAGQEALSNVTNLSPEEMAGAMTKLGVGLNNTLQGITSGIIQGRTTLADLEKANNAKTKELENLFGQETMARTIGNLIADHDAQKKAFEATENELAEAQIRQEAVNNREQAEWARQFNKDCERAKTNFKYEFDQNKRQVEDALAQQLQGERRTFADAQREADRVNADTETAIQARGLAVAEREQEADGIEEKLKAKFNQEKNAATSSMKKDHDHQVAIAQTQADTQAQIAKSAIDNQAIQIAAQQAEIIALKGALVASQEKNTELAGKAIDGASHQFALDAVMQQGDNNGSTSRSRGKN